MDLNNDYPPMQDEINKIFKITIIMNLILVIIKLWAGYLANSNALLADGLHSVSDIVTTLGVILGMTIARRPRDEKHQYGHEKVETLAAFLLSIILIYTGFRIGHSAISALIGRKQVTATRFAFFAAIFSITLKELQYQITIKVGKRANSNALIADAWHHRSDALSSIAALMGIIGAQFGFYILDSIAGVLVSLIVMKVGIEIFKDSFHQLMDTSIHIGQLEEIKRLILKQQEVQNINDIRSRRHGSMVFIDIKLCVDPYMEIYKGHEVAEEVETIIKSQVKNVKDVVVHLDPCFEEDKMNKVCGKKCKYCIEERR